MQDGSPSRGRRVGCRRSPGQPRDVCCTRALGLDCSRPKHSRQTALRHARACLTDATAGRARPPVPARSLGAIGSRPRSIRRTVAIPHGRRPGSGPPRTRPRCPRRARRVRDSGRRGAGDRCCEHQPARPTALGRLLPAGQPVASLAAQTSSRSPAERRSAGRAARWRVCRGRLPGGPSRPACASRSGSATQRRHVACGSESLRGALPAGYAAHLGGGRRPTPLTHSGHGAGDEYRNAPSRPPVGPRECASQGPCYTETTATRARVLGRARALGARCGEGECRGTRSDRDDSNMLYERQLGWDQWLPRRGREGVAEGVAEECAGAARRRGREGITSSARRSSRISRRARAPPARRGRHTGPVRCRNVYERTATARRRVMPLTRSCRAWSTTTARWPRRAFRPTARSPFATRSGSCPRADRAFVQRRALAQDRRPVQDEPVRRPALVGCLLVLLLAAVPGRPADARPLVVRFPRFTLPAGTNRICASSPPSAHPPLDVASLDIHTTRRAGAPPLPRLPYTAALDRCRRGDRRQPRCLDRAGDRDRRQLGASGAARGRWSLPPWQRLRLARFPHARGEPARVVLALDSNWVRRDAGRSA